MLTTGLSIWGDYSESATKSYTAIEAAAIAAARRNDAMLFYVQDSRANVLSNSDAAYAIPTVGQAVGKWLDSQYGIASIGPELVTNGNFNTGIDGWTQTQGAISWNSGVLRTSKVAGVSGRAIAPITCEVGATYRIMVDRSTAGGLSSAGVVVAISAFSTAGGILSDYGGGTTWSTMDRTFIATQTTHWIYLAGGTGTDGQYAEFDNVSVKKISEAPATRGPELLANFDFSSWTGDDPNGWSLSSSESTNIYVTNANPGARLVSTDGTLFHIFQSATPAGKTYEVTIRVTAITGSIAVFNGSAPITPLSISAPGVYRAIFTSTGVTLGIKRATAGVACDATIAWMSCKEVLGYHGSQPTVANKPTLARVPRKKQADSVINGGFDSSSGWTLGGGAAISGGTLQLNAQFAYVQQEIAGLEVGASYEISYDVTASTGGTPLALSGTGFTEVTTPIPAVAGVKNYYIAVCTNASLPLKMVVPDTGTTVTIDNLQMRKIVDWSYAVTLDGVDDWLDVTYRDYFAPGEYTFIASWWGPITGSSSFGLAQSSTASNTPLVSPLFIPPSSIDASIFERSDSSAIGLPGTTYATGALGRTSVVELTQIASPAGNFKGYLGGTLDRNTNYTRVTDSVTTNKVTLGAAQRTTVSNYAKGTIALLCLAPSTMPDADRRAIARFAAALVGETYA